jgi:hypothetical protein
MNALLIEETEDNFSGEFVPPSKVVEAGNRDPKPGQLQVLQQGAPSRPGFGPLNPGSSR